MQKKVAEILTIQTMKLPALLPIQTMKLPALLTIQAMKLPMLQDQMILIFMELVYLLSLRLAFVYFLHTTLSSLKLKKLINEKQDQPPKRRHML